MMQEGQSGAISRAADAMMGWVKRLGGAPVAQQPVMAFGANAGADGVDWYSGADGISSQILMGTPNSVGRMRQIIYQGYTDMLGDGLVSQALHIHVTAALGGHEAKGQLIFIEAKPGATADQKKQCQDMQRRLGAMLDKALPTVGYNAVAYGDGYCRPYGKAGVGLVSLVTGDVVLPPLIQAYERAGKTVAYMVATGPKQQERMNIAQIARMKMPRMNYVAQPRSEEKAVKTNLLQDDADKLVALPAEVGGSFLAGLEEDFTAYRRASKGLVAQRIKASIDETYYAVNLTNSPPAQQKRFLGMLQTISERAAKFYQDMAESGTYWFGKLTHYIPVSNEKQVVELRSNSAQASSPTNITIDDVMYHAKKMAGGLGIDLTMVGFSDLLSGGLGEGGFLRNSIQTAERSRLFRVAAADFVNHLLSLDRYYATSKTYSDDDCFWDVKFAGGISAQQAEAAKTKSDQIGAASMLVATMAQLKDLGLSKDGMLTMLKNQFGLDEDEATTYANDLAASTAGGAGDEGEPL
jgi:hypothetical protein